MCSELTLALDKHTNVLSSYAWQTHQEVLLANLPGRRLLGHAPCQAHCSGQMQQSAHCRCHMLTVPAQLPAYHQSLHDWDLPLAELQLYHYWAVARLPWEHSSLYCHT